MKPEVVEKLTQVLPNNKNLHKLVLTYLSLTEGSANNLIQFFSNNYNLEDINLSWCKIFPKSLALVVKSLQKIKNLRYLSLNGLNLDIKDYNLVFIESLSHLISTSLFHLDVSHTNISLDSLLDLTPSILSSRRLTSIHMTLKTTDMSFQERFLKILNSDCKTLPKDL